MPEDRHIYGEVDNQRDLTHVFSEIEQDVEGAKSREDLTELHRRAGYLITLTYAPSWRKKFGDKAEKLRDVAEDHFRKVARDINKKAEEIGTEANYDEEWGQMKKKGRKH